MKSLLTIGWCERLKRFSAQNSISEKCTAINERHRLINAPIGEVDTNTYAIRQPSIAEGRKEGCRLQIGLTIRSKTSYITCPTPCLRALYSSGEVLCSTDRMASSI